MPVVRIELARFSKMVGAPPKLILERLPYVGLDIESADGDSVRVEYSPNRPDFGTEYGIARALRGILGKEKGLPQFRTTPSGITVTVDRRVAGIRPFIACATATGFRLSEEDIGQLIALQEDLHNGLGRKRRRVAIGLHDLGAVSPPIKYFAVDSSFRFRPLDGKKKLSIEEILLGTEQGRTYGPILARAKRYPLITDSKETVLSFPPVVNGHATKLSARTRGLFIDVTSEEEGAGDDVLAILATTLAEMGARVGTVSIKYAGSRRETPDLSPVSVPLDLGLIHDVTGLELSRGQVVECLRRSRLDVRGKRALAARYRVDLLHPVDIAEEVALGFGIDRMAPIFPSSNRPGAFNPFEQFLDKTSDVMAGSGMIELMTNELVDEESLYRNFSRSPDGRIAVENPRSLEHSILRDSLTPSLASALSRNAKADYPQLVFEIGRVYMRSGHGLKEEIHLGGMIAHADASFTEASMHVSSVLRILTGKEARTAASSNWAFAPGRTASVSLAGRRVGELGELSPAVLASFGIKVPVAGFEIDLSSLYKQLK